MLSREDIALAAACDKAKNIACDLVSEYQDEQTMSYALLLIDDIRKDLCAEYKEKTGKEPPF